MKPYGIIYKITNKINGKVYIGQTTKSLEKRWVEHKYTNPTRKYLLHKSMDKHGRDNFEIQQLAEAFTSEELDFLEIKYIKEFNSISPNGYNLELGGNKYKKLSIEMKEKIRDSNSGFKCNQPGNKAVTCMDIATGIEMSYPSMGWAKQDGFCRQAISACCNGKYNQHGGKKWKWASESEYKIIQTISMSKGVRKALNLQAKKSERPGIKGQSRPIKAVNIITGETLYFKTVKEAAVKGFEKSGIFKCLNGNKAAYKNYVWSDQC